MHNLFVHILYCYVSLAGILIEQNRLGDSQETPTCILFARHCTSPTWPVDHELVGYRQGPAKRMGMGLRSHYKTCNHTKKIGIPLKTSFQQPIGRMHLHLHLAARDRQNPRVCGKPMLVVSLICYLRRRSSSSLGHPPARKPLSHNRITDHHSQHVNYPVGGSNRSIGIGCAIGPLSSDLGFPLAIRLSSSIPKQLLEGQVVRVAVSP